MDRQTGRSRWHRGLSRVALMLILLSLLGSMSWSNAKLVESRLRGEAGIAPRAAEPPPALTFVMVGLGAFRGIIAEVLWFRADMLQQEGRYFEMVQLANWITALDPYASEAWAYNAWNLAYNISALMLRPADKLRWVFHGVRLLRDEALKWNPNDAHLCRELAWLYLHKIGGDADTAGIFYRKHLATEIAPQLGVDGTFPPQGEATARLAHEWHLDSDKVAALEAQSGALDWRLPESHALYWGWLGMQELGTEAEHYKSRRLVCAALRALYGRMKSSEVEAVADSTGAYRFLDMLLANLAAQFTDVPSLNNRRLYGRALVVALREAHRSGKSDEEVRLYTILLQLQAEGFTIPSIETIVGEIEMEELFLPDKRAGASTE